MMARDDTKETVWEGVSLFSEKCKEDVGKMVLELGGLLWSDAVSACSKKRIKCNG